MPAGPNLYHRRTQALYIKERNHVAQIGYHNCYCLFIDGNRFIPSGRTGCFRQKLLAERGGCEPSAAECRVGGPLSAFAFDNSGPRRVVTTYGSAVNGPYQGGPHPR